MIHKYHLLLNLYKNTKFTDYNTVQGINLYKVEDKCFAEIKKRFKITFDCSVLIVDGSGYIKHSKGETVFKKDDCFKLIDGEFDFYGEFSFFAVK